MLQSTETITPSHTQDLASHRVVDIFIGGLLDRNSCIVCNYRKIFHRRYPDHTTFYFEYDQPKEIIAAVMAAKTGCPGGVFNLIGHSWGAITAIEVANALAKKGVNIDKVLTIDPVSRKRGSLAKGTTKWLNLMPLQPPQMAGTAITGQ